MSKLTANQRLSAHINILSLLNRSKARRDLEKELANPKKKVAQKVVIGKLVKVTPNGRHGWYETNIGLIKKPIQ